MSERMYYRQKSRRAGTSRYRHIGINQKQISLWKGVADLSCKKLFFFLFFIDNLFHREPAWSWSTTTLQFVEARLSLRHKTAITLHYIITITFPELQFATVPCNKISQ